MLKKSQVLKEGRRQGLMAAMRIIESSLLGENCPADIPSASEDWNINPEEGTYRTGGGRVRPIPQHPALKDMYWFVFNLTRERYGYKDAFWQYIEKEVVKRFGKLDDEVMDFLMNCPHDAGYRAGMLIEEPDHYE